MSGGDFEGSERFEVHSRLGEGGMGVVYDAFDRHRGARVALKTLRRLDPDRLLHLKNEFRALRDLHHENLVTIGDLVEERGRWFVTMELVDGDDFLSWVRSGPPAADDAPEALAMTIPAGSAPTVDSDGVAPHAVSDRRAETLGALDIARLRQALTHLARGLAALHDAGKVHRDVKPSNVRVSPDGRLVLLDFGLASESDERPSSSRVVGTVAYMAPEQARGDAVGAPADCYAVGVMLYEALTGRVPFSGPVADVLARKLNHDAVAPSRLAPDVPADLEQLCVELLSRNATRRPTARQILARLGEVPDDEGGPLGRVAVVGRSAELSRLSAALGRACAGHCEKVVIVGESGVGKTLLARAFLDMAAERGALALQGRCYEREHVPFKALDGIVDSLSARVPDTTGAALGELPADSALLLVRAFPVLGRVPHPSTRRPSTVDPVDAAVRRSQLLEAVRDLFRKITARQPVAVLVDDVQWADADSLALLAAVAGGDHSKGLLLLATARDELPAPFDGDTERVELGGLDKDDAARFVEMIAGSVGRQISRAEIAQVVDESGGHPLYCAELARRVDRPGVARLDALLDDRIDSLTPSQRGLLELLALRAAPLPVAVAVFAAQGAELAGDYVELNQLTTTLRAEYMVRGASTGGERIEPYHDRVRARADAGLPASRRTRLHRCLAEAFERHGGDIEALVTHWEGAGELDRAREYAVAVARDAERSLAYERAARYYGRALAMGAVPGDRRAALRRALGDALSALGRGHDAATAYLDAAADASGRDADALVASAADQLLRSGRIVEGIERLREALDGVGLRVPATQRRALMRLLWSRAILRIRGLGFRAVSESDVAPEVLHTIDLCWYAAQGLAAADTVRGAVFQAHHLRLALRAGEPKRVARALALEGVFIGLAGSAGVDRASSIIDRAAAINADLQDPYLDALVAGNRGIVAHQIGRWRPSLELLDHAMSLFRSRCRGASWEMLAIEGMSLYSLAYLGELGELRRRLEATLRDGDRRGDRYANTLRSGMPNLVWLARGDVDAAHRNADEAMRLWSHEDYHVPHYFDVLARAHIDLYVGRRVEAHKRVNERWRQLSRAFLLRVQHIRVVMTHLRGRCAVAVAQVEPARAAALVRSTLRDVRELRRAEMPWADAFAAVLAAECALLEERTSEGIELLEAAERQFDACEMALYAAAARHRRGLAVRGRQGAELVESASLALRDRDIHDPAALAGVLVPCPPDAAR